VASGRLIRILTLLRARFDGEASATSLCQVAAEIVGVRGAAIMLMSADVPRGVGCTSDPLSAAIEDLQYTLGEGPGIDAHDSDRPVLEPDLGSHAATRWVAFTPPAVAAGAAAVFAFPLRVGTVRLGALNLCHDVPGPLDDDQFADAVLMADVAARALLLMQAQASPDVLAAELEAGADLRLVVHQAAGMVSAQIGAGVAEALIRLRAYAFGNERDLVEVAEDVVARRLSFS